MLVFLNINDIVIIINSCDKFQSHRWILPNVKFMYTHNNYKRTLIQEVYLKSCYVKLCKRLRLANYDIDS